MIRRLSWALTSVTFVAIILVRAFSIGTLDLIDPTESRYAFVAQEMIMSGDWLTPKLPLPTGIEPYTGKPPLHFWLTAISMSLFGMDAWVTRLASILGMLIIMACVWLVAHDQLSDDGKKLAVGITISAALFFFIAGSSTVDITFSAWVSAAIAAFAVAGQDRSSKVKRWARYWFFAALALAFLTKGPASFVLVGATITFWMMKRAHWQHFPRLPWLMGSVLFFIIAAPWFILSAQKDPGFLHYFFVQENFLRFVSKNYGDRFGTGHVYPRGSALWMLLVGFLPWTLVLAFLLRSKRCFQKLKPLSPGILLALSWGIAPALFFSLARQLHAAYLLPGFGGIAIVLAKLIEDHQDQKALLKLFRILRTLTFIFALLALLVSLFFNISLAGLFVSLGLLIVLYMINSKVKLSQVALHSALSWALTVSLLYAITLVAFAPHAGRIKSTRYALSQIAPQLGATDRKLTFISHNSYSYYYYPRAWAANGGGSVETGYASVDQIAANLPTNLVLNKSDIHLIGSDILRHYNERGNFGKWRWWQKNT